jgi:thioredoxin-dependent peroxiredoxin
VSAGRSVVLARPAAILALSAALLGVACGGAPAAAPPPASANVGPVEATIAVTPEMGSPHPGDTAPDFELSDQHGAKVKLLELRGSVVVLAFVTSWCPFSLAEQPHLANLAAQYRGQNVKILAIDIKETDEAYARYLARVPMPIPVLRDPTGAVVASYTPDRAQPAVKDRAAVLVTSNLVIDPEGRIRLFTMVDTAHFDAELVSVRRVVDDLLRTPNGSRG